MAHARQPSVSTSRAPCLARCPHPEELSSTCCYCCSRHEIPYLRDAAARHRTRYASAVLRPKLLTATLPRYSENFRA
eukprot:4310441-Pleurochrysis_carterae.AAC.1